MGNGIQRQVYGYDDKIMLVKIKFEKSAEGQLHKHHHTQVTYIESGVFEMIGKKRKLKKEMDIMCHRMKRMALFV
jgi:quercetin dioxygenase-like cupin family protein